MGLFTLRLDEFDISILARRYRQSGEVHVIRSASSIIFGWPMEKNLTFRLYGASDRDACLGLFDANSPEFFAPNERSDYASFLDAYPGNYEVCLVDGYIVGAYGLIGDGSDRRNLNWILLRPQMQGLGIGSAIMDRVVDLARKSNLRLVEIAASHKSAPFFAKFGAIEVSVTNDGWGPGMHRVDMVFPL